MSFTLESTAAFTGICISKYLKSLDAEMRALQQQFKGQKKGGPGDFRFKKQAIEERSGCDR